MDNKHSNNVADLLNILKQGGYCTNGEDCRYSRLSGDGSDRSFFRVTTAERSLIGVIPANGSARKTDKGKDEALAAFNIGTHLKKRGVPVPDILEFDPQSGTLLFEDLGDTLLRSILPGTKSSNGAMTIPPPMPSRPDTNPTSKPSAAIRRNSSMAGRAPLTLPTSRPVRAPPSSAPAA